MSNTSPSFWDNISEKYARDPIREPAAYETTLDHVRSYLTLQTRMLEVGCGTGSTALLLAEKVGDYLGTDFSPGMIAIAKRKLDETDLTNLKFETASIMEATQGTERYDVIFGSSLLHLVPGTQEAINQMAHALAPGGHLITKTVCLRGAGFHFRIMLALMKAVGKAPFVAFLNASDLESMMREAGLEVIESENFQRKSPSAQFIVARKN